MSNQEHHEKKGSICQIKSTTKKKDQYVKSNVPQPSHICVIANHMIATSEVTRASGKKDQYVSSRAPRKKGSIFQIKNTTEERINMSVQEHHEKKVNIVKSRAPRKKRINMSNQEHHERKDQYVSSRAPRKKGSIRQIKSTTKERINLSSQEHKKKKDQ